VGKVISVGSLHPTSVPSRRSEDWHKSGSCIGLGKELGLKIGVSTQRGQF